MLIKNNANKTEFLEEIKGKNCIVMVQERYLGIF